MGKQRKLILHVQWNDSRKRSLRERGLHFVVLPWGMTEVLEVYHPLPLDGKSPPPGKGEERKNWTDEGHLVIKGGRCSRTQCTGLHNSQASAANPSSSLKGVMETSGLMSFFADSLWQAKEHILTRTVTASGSVLMQKLEQLLQGQRLHLLNLQESSLQGQDVGCRREQPCRRCITHPCIWSHRFINKLRVYMISKQLRTLSFHGRQCPKC